MRFAPALVALLAGSARGNDWYVDLSYANCAPSDGSTAKPHCTIHGAVAVAASGDTIHLVPGSYFETVTANVDVALVGTKAPQ